MALSNEDDTTQLASPRKKKVPVVTNVRDLIDIDPQSELVFETPPPDVVNSINECFEQFTSTLGNKSDASVHQPSSDSDSGGSLFITQSVTRAIQSERRHASKSISDDSCDERVNGDTDNENKRGRQHAEHPDRRKYPSHIPPRKPIFPFLLKSGQHLPSGKRRILENSEMGGFLKCLKKIEEGNVNKERAISPSMLESELSDNSEDEGHNSDHEVTKVDRAIFVPGYFKGNKHKWLPQSFLEMRIQDSLSNSNEQQLSNTNKKHKKSKTKSVTKKKDKAPKSKALVRTSSESSIESLFKEQGKQRETQEVLAVCSDAENSDSAHCRQQLTKQIVQSAENLHRDHLVVIEETQRNSIELITEAAVHIEHEDNVRSPSQADDIIELENAVSDLQPTHKQKMKKKHKLREQEEAEPGADTCSPDNVDWFSDSQTTETHKPPKRTKKRETKKDKKRTKMPNVEDDSGTDFLSDETFEAPVTKQTEHIQTSVCLSPNVTRLVSEKKNRREESQYESVDILRDVGSVSQFGNVSDRSTTQETGEERPSDVEHELNDAERPDSVQCAENLDEDHLEVIEEGQRETVEVVTEPAVEHENDGRPDNYLPNESNSMLPPQGGDISIQNDIQQTDSDFGSQDLFRPLNNQKHKTSQIDEAASIRANTEESDQDSDVTQIETEGPFESIFGQGTPRWWDGDTHPHEDNDSDETQIETEGQSVSVFGPGTPNKQFTTQDMNFNKHPEFQKTDQSPVGRNAELLSRRKKNDESNNIKRKSMSSSHKDSEDLGKEETAIVQPPPKHLPQADEPLREVYSSSCVRRILGKRKARAEMEKDLPESPLFRNGGLSFIKRKVKRNNKTGASDLIQCDTNADVSSESPVDDISEDKITPRGNKKSCEVENRVTNEEQMEASVLHLVETELLEDSILSVEADNSVTTKVKRKKKKRYKLNQHEDGVENQLVETVQFSKSQSIELLSKVTKKKKKKDKEKSKMAYVEENSATDIPLNETLDSDRPAELRVNEVNQTSEAPETDLPETSEEITGFPMPNVTTLKSVKKKKKKKKRDEAEETEYESVDLDVSSVSQFDHVAELGVVEQQDDEFLEEWPSNKNTAETLEGNTPRILKVAKRKNKSQNASSPSQSDDIIGLEIQSSGSQSESAEELLGKKKKKKQKLKERKNVELASDIGNNVQLFQQSESQTMDLLSRKTKKTKKRPNKDKERTTVSSSNKLLEHMDDGHSEMRGNVIQSTEATENDQLEHLQTSEEITRCPSPNVTKLSSGKRKKKKRDTSEKHQDECVDVNLDVSYMIERPNAAEHVEDMNSLVLSNNMFISKQKKKKKKKHKLKEQEEADIHSVDNVYLVEMDQFSKSQNTVMTPTRTKKKRKDKERTKTHVEDNSGTDILSNEIFEAPVTEQPEHIQTSEEIPRCSSPNITILKSGKKKKKKNGSKEFQYESGDFPLDVSSVSQQALEERPSDFIEHAEAELNDTKQKKKRKQLSLSIKSSSEFSSSDAQMQETVSPERKRKKKEIPITSQM
ncbi:hypothetical protein QQF64_027413 [Cirrhinus molitorella]|uniref:Uncharacterized protein n=1 Tax=Cirrhinus molitorella TaxID=172907 RepID=A0ABR3NCK9_9TELE